MRKYSLDTRYFSDIRSEAHAYWLGFLTADGSVGKGRLTVRLKKSDREHMEKMLSSLASEHPIVEDEKEVRGRRFPSCYVQINSVDLVRDLCRLGVERRKSGCERPWRGPMHLIPHYIRGLFDGDGSIGVYNKSSSPNPQWHVSFCGSYEIVDYFIEFVYSATGIQRIPVPHGKIWKVLYNGIDCPRRVIHSFYSKPTVAMSRKWELANRLLDTPGYSHRNYSRLELEQIYGEHRTWKEVAMVINMDYSTLYRRRKAVGL